MPSKAYGMFNFKLGEVEQVLQARTLLNQEIYMNRRGRRNLGALHKSALILLCAAWEAYVEELLSESLDFVISKVSTPTELSKNLQKELCDHVKKDKHELKALELCGDGWKKLCREIVKIKVKYFNTPRLVNVQNLYVTFFDEDVTKFEITEQDDKGAIIKKACWRGINNMVNDRCEHAHACSKKYLTESELRTYRDFLEKGVLLMDKNLCAAVQRLTSQRPWHYPR